MTNLNSENPFLHFFATQDFGTPDQAIPFEKIKVEHYLPAIDEAIRLTHANIAALKGNPAPADFNNTILALETASESVELAAGIYHNMFSAEASPELQALAQEISEKMASLQSEVSLDPVLFQRVKEVYERRQTMGLNPEQIMLCEKSYKSFSRNGALLPQDKKSRMKAIDQELASLGPKFSEHVMKAINAFELWIDKIEDLKGLPEMAIEGAAHAAESKGQPGKWLLTLQTPSYLPAMEYLEKRELREKLWRAQSTKCAGGDTDNRDIVKKMVTLRNERAQLLGYESHAAFVLEERMAKDAKTVLSFLERLYVPSRHAADHEIAELREFRKRLEGNDEIMAWDYAFYSEKLKNEKFQFSAEELRPYFKLENAIQGIFEHARRLYGLRFIPRPDLPVYHPDVQAFQVHDDASGDEVGFFYADFFPRATKRDGAWMTAFREQGYQFGANRKPHISIVCNFTKPTPSKPSLLSFGEVQTLFHEFGHALHGLLSKCTYRSIGGTNVYWDFVELPSQIMENWTTEKEALDLFAKHYESNSPIPPALIEKLLTSQHYHAGYRSLRQLNFALLDMSWHSVDPKTIADVEAFEVKVTEKTRVFPVVPGAITSVGFSHIFAGGYSAGYYSYKWAEVLDADAFEYFKEKGLFNSEVAKKFRDNVLSRGGSEHPMELYKRFRGREPDPNALLRRDGLLH